MVETSEFFFFLKLLLFIFYEEMRLKGVEKSNDLLAVMFGCQVLRGCLNVGDVLETTVCRRRDRDLTVRGETVKETVFIAPNISRSAIKEKTAKGTLGCSPPKKIKTTALHRR